MKTSVILVETLKKINVGHPFIEATKLMTSLILLALSSKVFYFCTV